jgi:hypothetical protein
LTSLSKWGKLRARLGNYNYDAIIDKPDSFAMDINSQNQEQGYRCKRNARMFALGKSMFERIGNTPLLRLDKAVRDLERATSRFRCVSSSAASGVPKTTLGTPSTAGYARRLRLASKPKAKRDQPFASSVDRCRAWLCSLVSANIKSLPFSGERPLRPKRSI